MQRERYAEERDARLLVPYEDELGADYFENCKRLADEGMRGCHAGAGCDEWEEEELIDAMLAGGEDD